MVDHIRVLLDEHWRRLEESVASAPNRLRTSELPTMSVSGNLNVAVDHEGRRHLLVPLLGGQRVRTRGDGSALNLRERPLEDHKSYVRYADLCCLRPDLNEVFSGLCSDVVRAVEDSPERPLKALYRVLDCWRALFQKSGSELGAEQLAGLFGELLLLHRLLELRSSAVDSWIGPEGAPHDFVFDADAIEVKASVARQERRFRVHGVGQLEGPQNGSLHLVWFRLARSREQGEGLLELIDQSRRLADDESGFFAKLALLGYRPVDSEFYQEVRFVVQEERWYEVDDSFPRILGSMVPASLHDVHYTVDLDSISTCPLEQSQVRDRLAKLLGDI